MRRFFAFSSVAMLLTSTGCVTLPSGPSVMVLPGRNFSFEQFHNDDAVCQHYAYGQIGEISPNEAAVASGVTSAIIGTALGAAVGAAVGGKTGAAVGAGTGLAMSSLTGIGASSRSSEEAQQRFDNAYLQCMYSKGHQVPVSGNFSSIPIRAQRNPSVNIPPPPPGLPPPPPSK